MISRCELHRQQCLVTISKRWAHLAELSYRHWSLQLSQLLYTLLKEGKSKNPFQSILGNKTCPSNPVFPTIMLSILGKSEPKEKEESLEYNTSKATAPWPHQSPKQGRAQRCLGRCLTASNYRPGGSGTVPNPNAASSTSTSPIKHHDFQSLVQRKGSLNSWQPEQRQKPPRLDTHPHKTHPTLPLNQEG